MPEATLPDAGATEDSGSATVDAGVFDAGVPAARQFCRDLIEAQAAIQQRCGTVTDGGLTEIVEAMQSTCERWPLPLRDFIASAAPACLQAHRTATCSTIVDTSLCDAVTPGRVDVNGACFEGADCKTGFFCDPSATCPGVCKPRIVIGQPAAVSEQCVAEAFLASGLCSPRVALGQSCAATTPSGQRRECVKGGFCNSSSQCVAQSLAGPGGDCNNVFPPCAVGLACLGGAQGCVPFAGEGAACGFGSAQCKIDLTCVGQVCVLPGNTGALCNFDKPCKWTHFCEREPGMMNGVCKTLLEVNEACDDIDDCRPGLFCNSTALPGGTGTCLPKRDLGAACTLDEECKQFARCATTCTALGSVGAACAAGNECLSGACASLKCTAAPFCVAP